MQGETGTSKMSSRNITQKNKEVDTGLFGNFGLQIVKDGHKSVLKHLIVKGYHLSKYSKTEPISKILWIWAKLNYARRGFHMNIMNMIMFLSTCNNVLC